MKVTYISWAESCSRSDHTARELGGRSHKVYLSRYGSRPTTIMFKYIGQWRMTLRLLRQDRPGAVFVMTPPVFAALPAFWYAWRHGARVVLDAHTAAFLHPRWRYLQWLQGALCRRAATTLVHNEHQAALVRGMGAHATVVRDIPIVYDAVEPFARPGAPAIAVVCSFNYDEPIAEILEAARLTPGVRFFMTGNPEYMAPDLKLKVPVNVTLTGFLSDEAYAGLVRGADAVMTLTTRDHTMLRAAYEAIYQGTPVIVSDWPLLRAAFDKGAVHVDNSASAIATAVARVVADPEPLREGARLLRARKIEQWATTKAAILRSISRAAVAGLSMEPGEGKVG